MRTLALAVSICLALSQASPLAAAVNFKLKQKELQDPIAGALDRFTTMSMENNLVKRQIQKHGSAGAVYRDCEARKSQSQNPEACVAVGIVKSRIRALTGENWRLVQAIAFTENRITHGSPEVDTSLKSHADAKGLMQVTKLIWNYYVNSAYTNGKSRDDGHRVLGPKPQSFDGNAPYGLNNSIIVGNAFLTDLKRKYCGAKDTGGCRTLIAAAYNAGEPNVAKHGGVPPFKETREYVKVFERKYASAK